MPRVGHSNEWWSKANGKTILTNKEQRAMFVFHSNEHNRRNEKEMKKLTHKTYLIYE